jgi:hypothetical protein
MLLTSFSTSVISLTEDHTQCICSCNFPQCVTPLVHRMATALQTTGMAKDSANAMGLLLEIIVTYQVSLY